jgi:diguanylate cyclase (GGDEF)-like protein
VLAGSLWIQRFLEAQIRRLEQELGGRARTFGSATAEHAPGDGRAAARSAPDADEQQRAIAALEEELRRARNEAELDWLTALHSRRYFDETLEREVARSKRHARRLALLVFDIDDFKVINDEGGHRAGDAALVGLANIVRDVVRSADIPCRIGGDEFAIVLPEATTNDAELIFRRLQEAIAARAAAIGGISLSGGIAEFTVQDDVESLFERADAALFRAKARGKGTFVVDDDEAAARPVAVWP